MFLFQCSYPGCGYIAEVVTNMHCKQQHGLKLSELKKNYGSPEKVTISRKRLKINKMTNEK